MHRRTFVIGALAALGMPRIAVAQQRRSMPLIGVMLARPIPNEFMAAFQRGLRELGYVEGQNIQVEYRSVEGRPERYAALAAEFVALRVDVIVAGGSIMAAREATSTIPIVFPAQPDPVSMGLEATQAAARTLGIELHVLSSIPENFDEAFAAAKRVRAEAMIVLPSSVFSAQRHRLVDLAAKNRLIAVYEYDGYPLAGGLISYGVDFAEMYRSAARYVDKILKGAKPADLPVEQATKFDLVINLKTAKALGLNIPPMLLVRADRVIE